MMRAKAPDSQQRAGALMDGEGAELGDAACQYHLAVFYKNGKVVEQDVARAVLLCEKAIEGEIRGR